MSYILETVSTNTSDPNWPANLQAAWKRYFEYLDSVKLALPGNAYEFARAEWHYSQSDHRSLHDAWLVSFVLEEGPREDSESQRHVNAQITLLGPYHDRHIMLRYRHIQSYAICASDDGGSSGDVRGGHGDWLLDEVRLSPRGLVIHEIVFRQGARWLFECNNVVHSEEVFK